MKITYDARNLKVSNPNNFRSWQENMEIAGRKFKNNQFFAILILGGQKKNGKHYTELKRDLINNNGVVS